MYHTFTSQHAHTCTYPNCSIYLLTIWQSWVVDIDPLRDPLSKSGFRLCITHTSQTHLSFSKSAHHILRYPKGWMSHSLAAAAASYLPLSPLMGTPGYHGYGMTIQYYTWHDNTTSIQWQRVYNMPDLKMTQFQFDHDPSTCPGKYTSSTWDVPIAVSRKD